MAQILVSYDRNDTEWVNHMMAGLYGLGGDDWIDNSTHQNGGTEPEAITDVIRNLEEEIEN